MAKIRNEGNRSKQLSFAAQTSDRTAKEEKTLRDFNRPGPKAIKDNHVDGTATKGHDRGPPPAEVSDAMAKNRGKTIHQKATQPGKNDGRSP